MNCPDCNHENHSLATFCSNCGHKLNSEKEPDYKISIRNISIFFFVILAYIIVLYLTKFGQDYTSLLIADCIFALIVLIFFVFNYKSIACLFHIRRFSLSILFKIVLAAPLFALLVNYVAKFLNQSILNQSESIYYNRFKDSPAPLLFTIISIALFPAIFEEIAFRGILFNESLKIMKLKPTILISTVLFTLLHLSFLSFLWIFPLGLVLGYLRAKYRTMLYGMILHFTYNAAVILIQLLLS